MWVDRITRIARTQPWLDQLCDLYYSSRGMAQYALRVLPLIPCFFECEKDVYLLESGARSMSCATFLA